MKLIAALLLVFSTLTHAGDKTFTDISTSPEVFLPVIVGTSLVGIAALMQ
jgi:hypothetical protein